MRKEKRMHMLSETVRMHVLRLSSLSPCEKGAWGERRPVRE